MCSSIDPLIGSSIMILKDHSEFLKTYRWENAKCEQIPGDASLRKYIRLSIGEDKRILTIFPKKQYNQEILKTSYSKNNRHDQEDITKLLALPAEDRKQYDYSVQARLADDQIRSFYCLTYLLRERGFSAPEIFAVDEQKGLMLIEDLGKGSFSKQLNPANKSTLFDQNKINQQKKSRKLKQEKQLYQSAIQVLVSLFRSSFPSRYEHKGISWIIHEYDQLALLAEANLFIEWYHNVLCKKKTLPESALLEWEEIWKHNFRLLDSLPKGLALRDFHVDNLFWLPDRSNHGLIGLIDYQDALFVHPAYDLVSLLEDARYDIHPELILELIEIFLQNSGLNSQKESFLTAYAILGAQRHFKILGVFARLIMRDQKKHYLDYLPRVKTHVLKSLQNHHLEAVKHWIKTYIPDF